MTIFSSQIKLSTRLYGQQLPVRQLLRDYRRFYSVPGATSQPGFLTSERMEELQRRPQLMPEPLRRIIPTSNPNFGTIKPNLKYIYNIDEARAAIIRHVNQEPVNIMRMLRISANPSLLNRGIEEMSLGQLAQNIFKDSMENDDPIVDFEAASENLELIDEIGGKKESGALQDHIECSRVLKKRRKKMRKHKHKKRLRKNRYKNKRT